MSTSAVPVVFLPGLLCDAELWRPQVEGLADVAAPWVADLTLDDNLGAMAARVLGSAPPRFALAGLSMGGYVAFEILRRAPERVERLALLATSAAPDSPERAERRRRAMRSLERGRFLGVTASLLPQLVHASQIGTPVGQAVQAMARRVGGPAFLRQQTAILGRPDSRPDLGRIRVPTLVVVGDSDTMTPPPAAMEIHRGIAGSSHHVLADCGHLPALEKPEQVNALLRTWLGQA